MWFMVRIAHGVECDGAGGIEELLVLRPATRLLLSATGQSRLQNPKSRWSPEALVMAIQHERLQ
jgi:hypothetical protein